MTTVLVTGARGNTGREVAALLAARSGVVVRGGTTNPEALSAEGVQPVRFDWNDLARSAAALDGVDAVYAARPDIEDAPEKVAALARAAAHANTIVLLSEMGAEDMAPQSWVRRVEDAFLEAREGTWAILRPTWFAQVLSDHRYFRTTIQDEGRFSMPSAGAPISFVDTRDIAAVAVEALLDARHANRAFTLSGPEAVSLERVAAQLAAAAGKDVRYEQATVQDAVGELVASGADTWLVDVITDLYERVEAGRFGVVTSSVQHVTGTPARSLAAFVAEHAALWRS